MDINVDNVDVATARSLASMKKIADGKFNHAVPDGDLKQLLFLSTVAICNEISALKNLIAAKIQTDLNS